MQTDSTPLVPVHTGQTARPELLCEHCKLNPVRPPRGKVIARFCSSRCRAAYANEHKRIVLREVRRMVDEAKALLDQALRVAEILLPKGRRS